MFWDLDRWSGARSRQGTASVPRLAATTRCTLPLVTHQDVPVKSSDRSLQSIVSLSELAQPFVILSRVSVPLDPSANLNQVGCTALQRQMEVLDGAFDVRDLSAKGGMRI